MDNKIDLGKLQLELEPLPDDDKVLIYTTMGIYKPGVPMGHKCMIAELFCSDIDDKEDSAYQIGKLFKAAPQLLAACKAMEKQWFLAGSGVHIAGTLVGQFKAIGQQAKAAIAAVEGTEL